MENKFEYTATPEEINIPILSNDQIDFNKYMQETEARENVRPASEYGQQILRKLDPDDEEQGLRFPIEGFHLRLRPGEVTLWAGYNGSGKSLLQGQIMGMLVQQKQKCCIASFEMKPAVTMTRLCRQMLRNGRPPSEEIFKYLKSTDGYLWLYDQQGTVKQDRLIAVIRYCAEELKCQHIAIDSLMKCVRGEDDYNGQKDFIDKMTAIARDYNIHIHIVHHLRKGDSESRMPNKMDIKGSGSITDQVDNVIILWRNKQKEQDIEEGVAVDKDERDAVIFCEKQRNGDWEGSLDLYYSRISQRYMEEPEKILYV